MELDKSSSTPLYQQLTRQLQSSIESGMYPPGARLPTEGELCSKFDVSRVTVRKALDELGDKGYLVRKPGKGTFVVEKKIQRTLSGVIGFTEMCRMMGYKPGAKTVKIALEQPTEEQTKLLHLKDDEQMLVVDRIRTADDKPVLIESNQFSEQFAFLFDKDLTDTSMYQIIKDQTGIVYTKSSKTLEIIFANHSEARYLGVSKGYPLLCISSVIEDSAGNNYQLCQQRCIGDKFKLII